MTVVSRALDDLDRLAFRLSRTVRTQYPQLLTQGFTLSDLEVRLLPFRDLRRELANAGPEAFESTLLRLISGERGYVSAEASLQLACRTALLSPSPSMSLVRTWSSSPLRLASTTATPSPPAAAESDELFPMPSTRAPAPAPATATAAATALQAPLSGGPTASPLCPDTAAAGCRFCDNRLPLARAVTFCPHCGTDQTKRQCPACSTELDAAWKFCVTCGRHE